jgi:competence protein ComEC
MDDGYAYASPLVPALLGEAARDGVRTVVGHRGQLLDFGDGVTAEVVGPSDRIAGLGANNASIVMRLRFGRTTFLLTGDAERPEEDEMLAFGEDVNCDVLKVGHHGSHTSTSPEFLEAARPRIAIISVGKRNLYGHPSQDVIDRLRAGGAKVFRTDQEGAITCRSDGATVRVERMLK